MKRAAGTSPDMAKAIPQIDLEAFDALDAHGTAGPDLMRVDFTARWCGPSYRASRPEAVVGRRSTGRRHGPNSLS